MKSIVLNNGIEYFIIKDLDINGTIYTLFSNVDDDTDICFRKNIIRNGEKYYKGLRDKKELELVVAKFSKYMLENSNEFE